MNRLTEAMNEPEYRESFNKNCIQCGARFTVDTHSSDENFCCVEHALWYDEIQEAEKASRESYNDLRGRIRQIVLNHKPAGIELESL